MAIKIYTKTGDTGNTSLLGGKKVPKSDDKIAAYGDVDELNSFLGLLSDQSEITVEIKNQFRIIQETLFTIGSRLAVEKDFKGFELPKISEAHTLQLETWIDIYTDELPELRNFILPGGHPVVSLCHVCRTVCRRAERSIIKLNPEEEIESEIITFINRLSDYFFVMSRKMAQLLNVRETPWTPGNHA
jgi:cob(I)alamin adenosyltransferase